MISEVPESLAPLVSELSAQRSWLRKAFHLMATRGQRRVLGRREWEQATKAQAQKSISSTQACKYSVQDLNPSVH